jgi:hypothetical protein
LDAYRSTSSETEVHYRLEAAFWLTPLPVDGLLTLVCAWPSAPLRRSLCGTSLRPLKRNLRKGERAPHSPHDLWPRILVALCVAGRQRPGPSRIASRSPTWLVDGGCHCGS